MLVLDALQHRKHTTHFNVEQAIEAAHRIGARQTWFTHIAHGLAHEQTNRELPAGMRLAHDGLRVARGALNGGVPDVGSEFPMVNNSRQVERRSS